MPETLMNASAATPPPPVGRRFYSSWTSCRRPIPRARSIRGCSARRRKNLSCSCRAGSVALKLLRGEFGHRSAAAHLPYAIGPQERNEWLMLHASGARRNYVEPNCAASFMPQCCYRRAHDEPW